MKLILLIIFSTIFIPSFSQNLPKNNLKSKDRASRDINIAGGNQTINNYYYTINKNYNSKLSARDNAINATSGFFKKIKDTTSSPPIIKLGGFISFKNEHAFSFAENPIDPINATKVKGQILIDAVLRDSKGDEYARINDDSWEISNSNNIEYNNDSTAFEIRSGKRVVFQLEIIKDTVFCYGMFCSENGTCFYGAQDGKTYPPETLQNKPTQRFVLRPDFILQPIFKYPRFENLGVRETAQRAFNRVFR